MQQTEWLGNFHLHGNVSTNTEKTQVYISLLAKSTEADEIAPCHSQSSRRLDQSWIKSGKYEEARSGEFLSLL